MANLRYGGPVSPLQSEGILKIFIHHTMVWLHYTQQKKDVKT